MRTFQVKIYWNAVGDDGDGYKEKKQKKNNL